MTATSDQSENITLVNREALPAVSYTTHDGENVDAQSKGTGLEEDLRKLEVESLNEDIDCISLASQFHQDAIRQAGYGLFQMALLLVVGLALAADLAEILSIVFLVPSAGQELCLSNSDRTWLGGLVLCGMLFGSAIWGLLGDRIGRRRALLAAILSNALFGIIAAFMPNYNLLMVARLISGMGAGGIVPTAYVYYGEFMEKQQRGQRLTWLGLLWSFGGVFVALIAWAIIPKTGFVLMGEKQQYFCSWRVFSVLCSVPALASAISLTFVPESPRFLLEVGREMEAILIYKWIHKINNCNQPAGQERLSHMEPPSRQQLLGIVPRPITRSLLTGTIKGLDTFWQSVAHICLPPSARTTLILAILWCATAYSYYGLSVWLPQQLQRVEEAIYSRNARYYRDNNLSAAILNSSQENKYFVRYQFRNVVFTDLVLNHVRFINTTFVSCVFNNTRSSRTRFSNCEFTRTVFLDTDLYEDKFQNCRTFNCTFLNTVVGCPLDFDINFRLATVFAQVLCTHIAVLPGTAVTALSIDKFGRVRLLGISLFVASVCALFIWPLNSQQSIVAFEAITNFLFIVIWSSVQVVTTEVYSAGVRTTAFGLHTALSRAAGILGCIIYGSASGDSKAIPILMTAAAMLIGGIVSIRFNERKANYEPPLPTGSPRL